MSLIAAKSIDDLGRIVIPVEVRRQLNISTIDTLDVSIDGERIIIKKRERESELRDSIQNIVKAVKKRNGVFDAQTTSEIETILSMIANKLIVNKREGALCKK